MAITIKGEETNLSEEQSKCHSAPSASSSRTRSARALPEPFSKEQAKGFYAVHTAKPFFDGLCEFMSSGPLVLMVLEKENAIADLRKLMGATNPANADPGTIRKKFAGSLQENAIHGSDAEDTAAFEIGYWFAGYELI